MRRKERGKWSCFKRRVDFKIWKEQQSRRKQLQTLSLSLYVTQAILHSYRERSLAIKVVVHLITDMNECSHEFPTGRKDQKATNSTDIIDYSEGQLDFNIQGA